MRPITVIDSLAFRVEVLQSADEEVHIRLLEVVDEVEVVQVGEEGT
jgi:hypothetical protein